MYQGLIKKNNTLIIGQAATLMFVIIVSHEIRVMCGNFPKISIMRGGIIMCGHFQKFGEKLLTLRALVFTFLKVIIVLCGNMAKNNNRAEANKLMLSGKIFKN